MDETRARYILPSLSAATDEMLIWELEIRGFPEELVQPLRDFVRQPTPSYARLAVWMAESQGVR